MLSKAMVDKQDARVLVVGAGGIGCEIIKMLFKSKCKITLMDYDTISETNLNRQFCYRKSDVGKYKTQVLLEYFKSINGKFDMCLENGNLQQYDTLFFSSFDLLISAVDNNSARWFLNQMAIDHNLPMIDAGTSGYNGQAQYFIRHVSECRMCRPQLTEEGLAMCTLKGRPDRNTHCVQFALALYEEVRIIKQKIGTSESSSQFGLASIFYRHRDWCSKHEFDKLSQAVHDYLFFERFDATPEEGTQPIKYASQQSATVDQTMKFMLDSQNDGVDEQKLQIFSRKQLSIHEYSELFVRILKKLLAMSFIEQYDKDDLAASLFVYSTTNLRICNFKDIAGSRLRNMSYYECKDLSGRVIPAIASTNSIAAALQILLMTKLKTLATRPTYLSIKGFHEDKVEKYLAHRPKMGCIHCSNLYNYLELYVDMSCLTWGQVEAYLVQNVCLTLADRDIRCGQFVVVRNSGARRWDANKQKLLTCYTNLKQTSKAGPAMISIRYIPTASWPDSWKIVLVDCPASKVVSLKRGLSRQQYAASIEQEMHKISKANIQTEKSRC